MSSRTNAWPDCAATCAIVLPFCVNDQKRITQLAPQRFARESVSSTSSSLPHLVAPVMINVLVSQSLQHRPLSLLSCSLRASVPVLRSLVANGSYLVHLIDTDSEFDKAFDC
eukprot:m.10599 g.10599  ORF g.10599 m.10599 type:complete len:112 (+) comp13611_c0_seq2:1056-1391(+)